MYLKHVQNSKIRVVSAFMYLPSANKNIQFPTGFYPPLVNPPFLRDRPPPFSKNFAAFFSAQNFSPKILLMVSILRN